eukprot:TRINITY_DN10730_c0_g2_i5.p1 TRINITY_DN10730_c0_g2~~TRINITY_DN10730_c0_g2_i5.p1  ORF type:complete len:189 (-),score=13.04 TRINITY_DN10730_c0_g2_i5:199-765(-)
MSAKEMEGNKYWQEFYKYNTGCNGKLKLHRVRMDAPKGSPVILTDEQFLYAIQRRNLLLYQNKVKKLKHKLLKHMGSKKRVNLCLICKEPFQYYADVLLALKIARRASKAQDRGAKGRAGIQRARLDLQRFEAFEPSSDPGLEERRGCARTCVSGARKERAFNYDSLQEEDIRRPFADWRNKCYSKVC